jgi:hypothetical protein
MTDYALDPLQGLRYAAWGIAKGITTKSIHDSTVRLHRKTHFSSAQFKEVSPGLRAPSSFRKEAK